MIFSVFGVRGRLRRRRRGGRGARGGGGGGRRRPPFAPRPAPAASTIVRFGLAAADGELGRELGRLPADLADALAPLLDARHCSLSGECGAQPVDGDAADVGDLVDQAVALLAMRRDAGVVETLPGVRCDYASYRGRLDRIARTKATGEAIRRATKAALRAVPEAARVPPAELFDVLNRHQCNVYGVLGAGNADVALASFVGAFHLFNHSCCPNLVFDCVPREIVDDGPPRFALVALTAIEEGAELCHCYAPSAAGPSVRRAYLRQHHGFECTCARCGCDDPADELDFEERLERARCPLPGCGTGLSYQLAGGRRRCVQCGGTWDDEGSSGEESDG